VIKFNGDRLVVARRRQGTRRAAELRGRHSLDVHAFEANPVNFARPPGNPAVEWHDRYGRSAQCRDDRSSGRIGNRPSAPRESRRYQYCRLAGGWRELPFTVSNLVLDDAFSGVGGRRIVMKFDLQGHERQALAGAEALVRNNDVLLEIEIENPRDRALSSQMDRMGFRLTNVRHPDFFFLKR
jgi:hypothetical protein